jgi:hypothetical protein
VKLAIIVGHTKTAPGAQAVGPLSMSEYRFHRDIVAPEMLRVAKNKGIEAKVFLRDGIGMSGAARAVNKWGTGKACSIELHFNSATPAAFGTETLYDSFPASGQRLAQMVQSAMCEVLGRTERGNRGIKLTNSGRGAHNLISVKIPACLVESTFAGANSSESKLLMNNAEELGAALVGAAEKFLKTL